MHLILTNVLLWLANACSCATRALFAFEVNMRRHQIAVATSVAYFAVSSSTRLHHTPVIMLLVNLQQLHVTCMLLQIREKGVQHAQGHHVKGHLLDVLFHRSFFVLACTKKYIHVSARMLLSSGSLRAAGGTHSWIQAANKRTGRSILRRTYLSASPTIPTLHALQSSMQFS